MIKPSVSLLASDQPLTSTALPPKLATSIHSSRVSLIPSPFQSTFCGAGRISLRTTRSSGGVVVAVAVGGTSVGGTGVAVNVAVGGVVVAVGGTSVGRTDVAVNVAVGSVSVAGSGVAVEVGVAGITMRVGVGVAVAGTPVAVGISVAGTTTDLTAKSSR